MATDTNFVSELNPGSTKMQNNSKSTKPKGHREPTIHDAIKAGLLIPTQQFVAKGGVELLHQKDDKGYTCAHWACLGGHTEILRYLVEQGAPIDQPAVADPQSYPIHWGCTNGHVAIVDILLQQRVNIDQCDSKGCTPLIAAAQHGQTLLAGFLMGKGAKLQVTDTDGDNALHWAAFKGHAELMRLLIYSGFSPTQKDKYGQTALHLACINGNLNAVEGMCEQDEVVLDIPDKNGKTPYMLAAGRKHDAVMQYLKKNIDKRDSILSKLDFKMLFFGPPGNSKKPLMFFIVMLLFYAYPIYLYQCLYYTWDDLKYMHIFFWISNVFMWYFLYNANHADPGYLPRNIPEYDMAIKQIAHFNEWNEGSNPLSKLCHSCRTIKPLRSKHCKVCNRCVRGFDHHCPWIYNCVGQYNRHWFFGYLICCTINAAIGCKLLVGVYHRQGYSFLVCSAIPLAGFFTPFASALIVATVYLIATNQTTNESINYKRYEYLKDSLGKYRNPFHRGAIKNILEYFQQIPQVDLTHMETIKVM